MRQETVGGKFGFPRPEQNQKTLEPESSDSPGKNQRNEQKNNGLYVLPQGRQSGQKHKKAIVKQIPSPC